MKEVWSVPELAELLNVAPRYLRLLSERGEWPRQRVTVQGGQTYSFRFADLPTDVQTAILRSQSTSTTPANDDIPPVPAPSERATLAAWSQWRAAHAELTLTEAREAFAAAEKAAGRPLSARTLRRWEAEARQPQESVRIAPRPSGPGAEIPEEARRLFEALYLDQGQPTVMHCYRITSEQMAKKGVEVPSYHAFVRYANAMDPAVVTLGRQGFKALEQRWGSYIKRDLTDLAANDVWVGDHHRLDILCKGDKPGRVARPWLTAWQDLASRMVMGWHVFVGEPSADTILLAFRRGAEAYGVPRGVYIDNGQDYRSQAVTGAGRLGKGGLRGKMNEAQPEDRVRSLVSALGLEARFALPFNARAKVIERWFCTLKDQFCRLWPSFVGGNPQEKPERVASLAWETLPTVDEVISKFVEYVRRYHASAHEGLRGRTPAEVWASRLERKRVLPEWALRLCCLRASRPVKVARQGVQLYGTHYWAPELLSHFEKKVVLRYDPEAMGEVHVYDTKDKWICTAKNVTALAHGAGAEELKAAMREQRARLRAIRQAREAYGQLAKGESALDLYLGEATPEPPKPAAAVVELVPAKVPERPRVEEERGPGGPDAKGGKQSERMATVLDLAEAMSRAKAEQAAPEQEAFSQLDFARAVAWARGQEV